MMQLRSVYLRVLFDGFIILLLLEQFVSSFATIARFIIRFFVYELAQPVDFVSKSLSNFFFGEILHNIGDTIAKFGRKSVAIAGRHGRGARHFIFFTDFGKNRHVYTGNLLCVTHLTARNLFKGFHMFASGRDSSRSRKMVRAKTPKITHRVYNPSSDASAISPLLNFCVRSPTRPTSVISGQLATDHAHHSICTIRRTIRRRDNHIKREAAAVYWRKSIHH